MTKPPSPDLPVSRAIHGVAMLEHALAICVDQVAKGVAYAESINTKASDYYDRNDAGYNRSLAYLEKTAKIGMALAKLKGQHTTIRIHRTEPEAAQLPQTVEQGDTPSNFGGSNTSQP